MKRTLSLLLALVLTLGLCACGDSSAKWQEQYDLGQKYLTKGNYEEAILAFTAAIEIDAKNPLAYIGRGRAYIASGTTEDNLAAAQTDFETAINLDDSLAEAYLGLAEVYLAKGEPDGARETLEDGFAATGDVDIQASLNELMDTEGAATPVVREGDNGGLSVDAENFTLRARNGRSAVLTLSGLSLRESYPINQEGSELEFGEEEYLWQVEMFTPQGNFAVYTVWWYNDGDPSELILEQMWSQVGVDNSGWYESVDLDAGMTHTADSISWDFAIPEEYSFDFAQVERYVVTVKCVPQGLYVQREYVME